MKEYNGYLIVKIDEEYIPMGDVQKPSRVTTKHKVIELANEAEYLAKCKELNIELDD